MSQEQLSDLLKTTRIRDFSTLVSFAWQWMRSAGTAASVVRILSFYALAAIGGSGFLGAVNILGCYVYAWYCGFRLPVEGVPYVGLGITVVSLVLIFLTTVALTLFMYLFGSLGRLTYAKLIVEPRLSGLDRSDPTDVYEDEDSKLVFAANSLREVLPNGDEVAEQERVNEIYRAIGERFNLEDGKFSPLDRYPNGDGLWQHVSSKFVLYGEKSHSRFRVLRVFSRKIPPDSYIWIPFLIVAVFVQTTAFLTLSLSLGFAVLAILVALFYLCFVAMYQPNVYRIVGVVVSLLFVLLGLIIIFWPHNYAWMLRIARLGGGLEVTVNSEDVDERSFRLMLVTNDALVLQHEGDFVEMPRGKVNSITYALDDKQRVVEISGDHR